MPKIGIKLTSAILDPDMYLDQAREVESAGFDSVWLSESIIRPARGERPYPPQLEPFTLLAALSAVTRRVRLGTSVSVVAMWPPVLFAAKATTLDHLSRGRLVLGVGAGWEPFQFSANGLSFSDRGRRLDEFLAVIRHLWGGSSEPFEGDFYRIPGLKLEQPLQRGGPPVLVGAFSEPGYRRAARVADGFIHGGGAPERVKATFDHIRDLRRQMAREGPFEFWVQVSAPRDREGWQRAQERYQAAGADGLIVDAGRGVLEIIR